MMDNPGERAPAQRPAPRQVILGLFVVGQLAFLLLANALDLYQAPREQLPAEIRALVERVLPGYATKEGQAWTVPDETAVALRRWSELTGQDQRWSLFAPGVYKVTGFPAVVLVGEDDPASADRLARTFDLINRPAASLKPPADGLQVLRSVELEPPAVRAAGQALAPLAAMSPREAAVLTMAVQAARVSAVPLDVDVLRSDDEPADRRHFARLGKFRLRRLESSLILYLRQRDDETVEQARGRWDDDIRKHVTANADAIYFYLQWRWAAYRERYPDRPAAKQVILVERVFKIMPPGCDAGDPWQGPHTMPLARWRPGADVPKDGRPIERYNPVTARFETVPK